MNINATHDPDDPRTGGNAAVMDEPAPRTSAPWHLWVIGFLASVFMAFGAWDYLMKQLRDPAYITSMSEPVGVTLEQALSYFDAMPVFAHAAWAVAVWGTLAGSLMLLARSGWSRWLLTIGLVGMTVSTIYQQSNPITPGMDTSGPLVFAIILFVIVGALIWYAHAMWKRGVLR